MPLTESAGQSPGDFESEVLPETERSRIGRDDEIKLHCAVTKAYRLVQTMFSHHSSDPTTLAPWSNHEAGICYVRPQPWLVGLQNVSADYFLLGHSDIAPRFRAEPVSQCLLTGNVWIKGISIASANNRMKDSPNGRAVFSSRATDSQRLQAAVATLVSRARHRIFCFQSEAISPIFQMSLRFFCEPQRIANAKLEIREMEETA